MTIHDNITSILDTNTMKKTNRFEEKATNDDEICWFRFFMPFRELKNVRRKSVSLHFDVCLSLFLSLFILLSLSSFSKLLFSLHSNAVVEQFYGVDRTSYTKDSPPSPFSSSVRISCTYRVVYCDISRIMHNTRR